MGLAVPFVGVATGFSTDWIPIVLKTEKAEKMGNSRSIPIVNTECIKKQNLFKYPSQQV